MHKLSPTQYLFRYGLFGMAIAFAGPPIFIHAPTLYAQSHGVGLALLGAILLGVRALDFIQDPILGWWIAKAGQKRLPLVLLFSLLLSVGMIALFAPTPLLNAGLWFALSLALVFTGFSGLQIMVYSTGLNLADHLKASHARVAAWRETMVLIGVCAACVAPAGFAVFFGEAKGYALYAGLFLVLTIIGLLVSAPVWRTPLPAHQEKANYKTLLADKPLRWLLTISLVNSLPTGISSTLFLFYVGDRLGAKAHAGSLLLLFFLFAGLSVPIWRKLAERYSAKSTLLAGMVLSVCILFIAVFLTQDDLAIYYIVCIVYGIATGADILLIPAMMSARLEASGQNPAYMFGLWGFVSKFSTGIAAGVSLPLLALTGFMPGAENTEASLQGLALVYAALPCTLKILSIITLKLAPVGDKIHS